MSWKDHRVDEDFIPKKSKRKPTDGSSAKKKAKKRAKKKHLPKDHKKKKAEVEKEKILGLLLDPLYRPMKMKEIAILLDIPKSKRDMLESILDELVAEGSAFVSKRGKYQKTEEYHGEVVTGIYTANPKGFGFVTVEGYEEDFYISPDNRNHAMHKDTVEVEILPKPLDGKRQEAKVLSITEHGMDYVVGTYEKSKHFGFVIPDDPKVDMDVFIPEGKELHAVTGHKVVATITNYGGKGKKPEGIVVEILGHRDDPGTDILSIVKAMGIPTDFPEEVLSEANQAAVPVTDSMMKGRMDLRDQLMVTIDGDDSKDLDDAISLTKDGENYILGVHIADVSEYVKENSALDKEARKRGTSVYLVDRVIPMLPRALSNGMCSLNHNEDRLAMSCIMTVNPKGEVIDHVIAESIVNIDYRMTYHNVKGIVIDHDEALRQEYDLVTPMLDEMLHLSKLVRAKRHQDGCIDFDFPEYKIQVDEKCKPISIELYEHSEANELIEDFMILANETVAEEYCKKEIPFLYRTHGVPDHDRIHDLSVFIENFGLTLRQKGDELQPKEVQELLEKVKGKKEEALISMLTLRSMQQAKYETECIGHFGLAAKFYSHFTSPIRRYPDLQIHRIMKEDLRGKLNQKRIEHYRKILDSVAKETSMLERRSDEAEREVSKLKKAEYMQMHLGETYTGIISGVTAWGIYVQLPNSIEGLVHVSTLTDDYYRFDEKHYCMIGECLGKVYHMSQSVVVKVAHADTDSRTIDFELVK